MYSKETKSSGWPLLLSGAIALSLALPPSAHARPRGEAPVREGQIARLFPGECSVLSSRVEIVGPLIVAAAGFAGDLITKWIGGALQRHKDGLTGQFVAGGVGENPTGGKACLRIYRGPIGPEGLPQGYAAIATAKFLLDAEIAVTGTADAPVWTVTPSLLVYARTVARTSSKTKHVSVVIGLTSSTPADPTKLDQPIAVFRHDLGKLKVGTTYRGGVLDGTASRATLAKHGGFNITVLVTESAEPSPALTALLGAFSDNQDKLSAAIADIIKSSTGGDK